MRVATILTALLLTLCTIAAAQTSTLVDTTYTEPWDETHDIATHIIVRNTSGIDGLNDTLMARRLVPREAPTGRTMIPKDQVLTFDSVAILDPTQLQEMDINSQTARTHYFFSGMTCANCDDLFYLENRGTIYRPENEERASALLNSGALWITSREGRTMGLQVWVDLRELEPNQVQR